MAKVITFINMKGGVGKTTLAVNVAYALSKEESRKVLLIDMDPQMNATQYALTQEQVNNILRDKSHSIYGFLSPEYNTNSVIDEIPKIDPSRFIFKSADSFDIIPSSLDIMNINLSASPFKLAQYINENLSQYYDVIIIDCPPTVSEYTKVSLLASNAYVVPMKADPLAVFGLPILQNYIKTTIKKEFQHDIDFLGIILNMVFVNKILYKNHKSEIQKRWPAKLFQNELKQYEEISKSIENNSPECRFILNMKDNSITEQIKNITRELIQKGRLI